MDGREFLTKAQEAEAFANTAESQNIRESWEQIAQEYRKLAAAAIALRTNAKGLSEA